MNAKKTLKVRIMFSLVLLSSLNAENLYWHIFILSKMPSPHTNPEVHACRFKFFFITGYHIVAEHCYDDFILNALKQQQFMNEHPQHHYKGN